MRTIGISLKWLLRGNFIRNIKGGVNISPNARLKKCKIYIHPEAELIINDNVIIEYADIFVEKGTLRLEESSMVKGTKEERTVLIINNGSVVVHDHAKLSTRRVWVRFGGVLDIGRYTNINADSEIRCDDNVLIGAYNQISYNVRIWDTNTHSLLDKSERRTLTESRFPYFGYEKERPITSPVKIGNDCWIGESCAILKGTTIGNECVLGYGTFVVGKKVPDKSRVINERCLRIDTL